MTGYEFQIEYANTKSELDIGSINQLKSLINTCAMDIIIRLFRWFDVSDAGFKLPKIIFDDSCPTDEHYDGDLSVDEVRAALISLLSEYPNIDSPLRKMIQSLDNTETSDDITGTLIGIRRNVTETLFDPSASSLEKEFAKKAGGIIIRNKTDAPDLTSVLGRFNPKSNKIFLYYNNWGYDYDRKNIRRLLAKIIITLARELFHAFHYSLAGKLFLSSGAHPEIVKEACADFFSMFYCLLLYSDSMRSGFLSSFDEAKDEATLRYNEWREWFVSKGAYTKALYFLRLKDTEPIDANSSLPENYSGLVKYGSIEKLREVIRLSKSNMERAYHALIYDEDDYIIPYADKAGKKSIDITLNNDPETPPEKKIVEFSIIHHTKAWGKTKPPVRYTLNMEDCTITEIHYKSDGINPPVDSRITIQADPKLTEGFFTIVNALDWSKDYIVPAFDGGSWNVTLIYNNHSRKSVSGTCTYSPVGAVQLTTLLKQMYSIAGYSARPYVF